MPRFHKLHKGLLCRAACVVVCQMLIGAAMAETSPLPDAVKLALATAEAEKNLAVFKKERAEAELATQKAQLGGVPSSGISGTVTVGEKGGVLEMGLLASMALNDASGRISTEIRPLLAADGTLYVHAGTQLPGQGAVTAFKAQRALLGLALRHALADANAAAGVAVAETAALPTLGLALESITKLLGFFKSDASFAGAEITLDDSMLVQATLRHRLPGTVIAPGMFDAGVVQSADSVVQTELAALSGQRDDATRLQRQLADGLVKAEARAADPATSATDKALLAKGIAGTREVAERLKLATTAYDNLVSRLLSSDEAVLSTLRGLVLWQGLSKANNHLLLLKVHRAAGSHYTKKNLWTNLGTSFPFYVAGGAVVGYTLLRGVDGAVLASGLLPMHGGYQAVLDVPAAVYPPALMQAPATAAKP